MSNRDQILGTAVFLGLAGMAAANTWTGGTSSDWATASNWSSGVPNGTNGNVVINNVSSATPFAPILTTAYALNPDGPGGDMFVGGSGTGVLEINSGGSLDVSGNWLFVGQNGGNGTININSGGAILGNNNIRLGRDGTGSVGRLNVNGGSISAVTGIITDNNHTGSLSVTNGGTVSVAGNIQLAGNATSLVSGSSSQLSASGELWIGGATSAGTNTMDMTGGTINSGAWFVVGRDSGSSGVFNQSGGTVNAATTSGGAFAVVGSFGGSTGEVNLSNGSFNAQGAGLFVGEGGNGTFTVSGTGDLNVTGGNLRIGVNNGASGNFVVEGSSATIDVSNLTLGINTVGADTTATGTISFISDAGGVSTIRVAGNTNLSTSTDGDFLSVDLSTYNAVLAATVLVGNTIFQDILLIDGTTSSGEFTSLAQGATVSGAFGGTIDYSVAGDVWIRNMAVVGTMVPEPSSLLLGLSGSLLLFRRRRPVA